ncbi:MAG: response regulator [Desulfobacterales bacterium]
MSKRKVNILLVDDNRKFLASVADRAKIKGFSVFTAEDGTKALQIAEKETIHVAVVDHRLPDMEGLVVITKLKSLKPAIQTILLTGHGHEKLKEATQALNSTYFGKEEMGRFWDYLAHLPIGNVNILLVDDNVKFVNTLAQRIRMKGYDPLIALNGNEAVEIARSNKITIAVVDQYMPDMEGLEVITRLKEMEPRIHTMLLTGHGDEKLKEATQALDSEYFEKGEMSKFWGFIRRNLQRLEKHMAAAGMATGGDIEDAVDIETSHERKE